MSQLPPLLKPILPPLQQVLPLARQQPNKWDMHKIGYDRMYLHCNGVLTRLEAFRLIGELERIAASL